MSNTPVSKQELQKRLDKLLEKKNSLIKIYGRNWKSSNPELYNENHKISRHITELKLRISDPVKWKISKHKHKKGKKNSVGRSVSQSARERGYGHVEPNLITKWYSEQKQICHYCSCSIKEVNNYLDKIKVSRNNRNMSIDRMDNSKGYFLDNLTLACFICNTHKKDFFSHEDFLKIAKKYIRPKIILQNM